MDEAQSPDARVKWIVMMALAREAKASVELTAAKNFLEKHASQNGLIIREVALW